MPTYRLPALCALALSVLACGGRTPDPYAGYYLGADKAVRIRPAGADAYQVRILGKTGREIDMQASLNEGRLTSEYGGGFSVTLEGGGAYTMGVPGAPEPIRKIDSAEYARWVRETRPDQIPSDTLPPADDGTPDDPLPTGKRLPAFSR
jgi:hypothetical protein